MARSGIDLIAERIENETTVVDLLDYDVRFGQGFLFSPPRPVRAEALHGSTAEAGKPGTEDAPSAVAGGELTSSLRPLMRYLRCAIAGSFIPRNDGEDSL